MQKVLTAWIINRSCSEEKANLRLSRWKSPGIECGRRVGAGFRAQQRAVPPALFVAVNFLVCGADNRSKIRRVDAASGQHEAALTRSHRPQCPWRFHAR